SLGVKLLSDLRQIFETEDKLFTSTILSLLYNLKESPWNNLKGNSISERDLANLLKPYDINSKQIRIGNVSKKGYEKVDLYDAWERYLVPVSPPSPEAKHGKHEKQASEPLPPPGNSETCETRETEKIDCIDFDDGYGARPLPPKELSMDQWLRDHPSNDNYN